jgi:hypothetical protein
LHLEEEEEDQEEDQEEGKLNTFSKCGRVEGGEEMY